MTNTNPAYKKNVPDASLPDGPISFRRCVQYAEQYPDKFILGYAPDPREFAAGSTYPRPNWWYGGGIDAFERAVKACPDTYFLGHAPGFWAHISGDDQYDKVAYPTGKVQPGGKVGEMLRKYRNLYCDISAGSGARAFSRDPEFAREFILEFQDRILYGRDYFDNVHQEVLGSLHLPDDVLAKIYSGNALKLVPLS